MRKVLALLAVIGLTVAIVFGVTQWLGQHDGVLPGQDPESDDGVLAEQPEWCPAVEVISVPGTGESRVDDDPVTPNTLPQAMLTNVTAPLQQTYAPDDVKVWTAPYPAQIKAFNTPELLTYADSLAAGRDVVSAELTQMHSDCPLTQFVMMGFSQGAAIAGDLAEAIGAGNGPVPAENVAGVALIGDPRRSPEQGMNPGVPLAGVGIELALAPVNVIVNQVAPGATMRGPRAGFGALNERVQDICAPGDSICDVPPAIFDAVARAQEMFNAAGAHASYAFNEDVIPGTPALAWVEGWARNLIDPQLN